MILKRLTVIAGVIVTLGIGSGRGAFLVGGSRAQGAPAAAAANGKPAKTAAADTTTQPEMDPLLKELIQAARRRLLAQKEYYRAGRITIDRYIAASSDLARVELLAAKSEGERRAIRRRHVQLAREVEAHEKAERDAGRGTVSDLAEANQGRVQAEFDMRAGEQEDAEKTSLRYEATASGRGTRRASSDPACIAPPKGIGSPSGKAPSGWRGSLCTSGRPCPMCGGTASTTS